MSDRAMSDQAAAAGSGGSNQPARGQQGGGGGAPAAAAAAAAGTSLAAARQHQESPQFVGVYKSNNARLPWCANFIMDGKKYQLGCCATRAEAAAAHDLALIWKRLHGKGRAFPGG
jgi:hypothetical protein